MKKQLIGLILALLLLYSLSATLLDEIYLFGWLTHNWKFYFIVSLLPILLWLAKCYNTSLFTGLGIILGVIVGQFGGDLLREYNLSQITENMSNEQISSLSLHQGFYLWMVTIIAFTIYGFVIDFRSAKQSLNN